MKRHSKALPLRPAGLRPEDAPLGSLESRAAARAWLLENRKHFQMIFGSSDENPTPLNLESSTCERQIWPDGSLFELIMLDGRLSASRDVLWLLFQRRKVSRWKEGR